MATGGGAICWDGGGGRKRRTATKSIWKITYLFATNVVPQKPDDGLLIHGISTWYSWSICVNMWGGWSDWRQGLTHHANPPGEWQLGWEFRFLVLISETPIRSGISIPFQIPGILVGFFFENSAVENSSNWNSDLQNSEFDHFFHVGTKYISFYTYIKVNVRKHWQYIFPPK